MPIRDWNKDGEGREYIFDKGLLSAYKGLKRDLFENFLEEHIDGLLSAYKGLKHRDRP